MRDLLLTTEICAQISRVLAPAEELSPFKLGQIQQLISDMLAASLHHYFVCKQTAPMLHCMPAKNFLGRSFHICAFWTCREPEGASYERQTKAALC
jgi:hypothetical protein